MEANVQQLRLPWPVSGHSLASTICLLLAFLLSSQPAWASSAEAFPRPPELEPAISFWTRVYTEIDTDSGFIHDSWHLDVVYETVRFKPGLSRKAKSRKVKRIKARYKKVLLRLAGGKRRGLSAEEQRILSLWPDDVSSKQLRNSAYRLRFQLGQADKFRAGLIRAGAWEPFIRQTLSTMGLPQELAALPHVESSYNPKAHSHVGASGLWQFTRPTGRRYMRVDHVIDERLDPFEASVAAARLLKHNYDVIGTWPLAITAYNHGAAGMRRAARRLGTKDIEVIVQRYRSRTFGFASRNFYVAFLAALDVSRKAEAYFGSLEPDRPLDLEVIEVPDYMTVQTLARALRVDEATLRANNPALLRSVWTGAKYVPRGYSLRLPSDSRRDFAQAMLSDVPAEERFSAQRPDLYHRVRRGDTLSGLAARYGTSVRELMALNGLRSRHHIRAGQVMRLPVRDVSTILASTHQGQSPHPSRDGTYRVRHGDTLSRIARRFDVDEQLLVSANGLPNKHRIYVGQTLRLGTEAGTGSNGSAVRQAKQEAPVSATDTASKTQDPMLIVAEGGKTALSDSSGSGNTEPDAEAISLPANEPSDANESARQVSQSDIPAIDSAVLEAVVARADTTQDAEAPASQTDDSDALDKSLSEPVQTALTADPNDYMVASDGSIEVQAAETLGHYAHWLEQRTNRIRKVNRMSFGQPVVIGRRLRLDFSRVKPETFEQRRLAYHQSLQEAFFERHQITGTCRHVIRPGESLWTLSHSIYGVPAWLLRQYNPDMDFGTIIPGKAIDIPILRQRETQTTRPPVAFNAGATSC